MTRAKRKRPSVACALSVLMLSLLVACSTDTPTAPQQIPPPPPGGASALWSLVVSITPVEVEVGSPDPATVSVVIRRADNQQAPSSGTTFVLSASLGEFGTPGSGLGSVALSTINGRAQVLWFAGLVKGTALFTAQLESSTGQATAVITDILEEVVASFETQNSESNLSIQFRDTSTGDPTDFLWDFGDGGTSTEQNPAYLFSLPGDYVVTLTASKNGSSDTTSQTVSVTRDPLLIIEASFETTVDALTVVFRDTSTGNPNRWRWSFGDGTSSSQQNPSKTYQREGSYVVTLTASNSQSSDDTSQTVTVGLDPDLVITASFVVAISNRTVTFQDTSTGDPTKWAWDFGDGSSSTAQHPTHTYAAGGSFVVILTASNNRTSDTVSQTVTLEGDEFFITAVTPNFGPESGGTPVTISGSGFSTPLRVSFGNVLATTVSVTSTSVMVLTPPFDVPSTVECIPVDVKVELGGGTVGTVTGGFTYVETGASCT